jgi:hypothetical protein
MKFLCALSLITAPLFAQPNSGSGLVDFGSGIADNKYGRPISGVNYLISNFKYAWQITVAANGDKTFNFIVYKCIYTLQIAIPLVGAFEDIPLPFPVCTQLAQSGAEDFGTIGAGLGLFNSLAPGLVAHNVVYGPFAERARPRLTVEQPATPPDPQMIMFDGLGVNMMKFDLTTFAILSQVPLFPLGVTTFGIRPAATNPENEVWTAYSATGAGGVTAGGITIVDLGAGKVVGTIPNNANVVPVNIVFTNSGNTALEAVDYATPDSSGNQGAILVFDAATRTLTSTLPLKNAPQQMLMAPDGLTAYILGSHFTITYYDVLSGTADLTAPFPLAFVAGTVFLHPDGTRLFVDEGYGLGVFDLTTHQISNNFSYDLTMYAVSISVNMSQDGSTVWVTDSLNNVTILDTRYGNVLATFPTAPKSTMFPGPAY